MRTDQTEIKPALRVVGVTQALGRIGVSAEYFGRLDTLQETGNLETVFQVYG